MHYILQALDWLEPLTFAVFGDGKPLWTSKPIRSPGDTDRCSVSVAGVSVLRLQVKVPQEPRGAHGAWVEPHLTK